MYKTCLTKTMTIQNYIIIMILQHISSSLIRTVFFTYSEEVLLAKPTSQLKENSQYCTLYSKISNVTIIIYMYIPIASDVSPNVVFKKN